MLGARRWALGALLLVSLPACAERNTIAPGDYVSAPDPAASVTVPGVRLTIAPGKTEVAFTSGTSVIKRSATAREQGKWPTLCPRGMKDTSSEVLDVGGGPVVLGPVRVEQPALVAQCTGKPIVELREREPDGKGVGPTRVSFAR